MTTLLKLLALKLTLLSVALAAQTAVYPVQPADPPISQFQAIPSVLKRVAACESTGNPNGTPRQFQSDGSILWGLDPITGLPVHRDCGEFQINTRAHKAELDTYALDVCHSQRDNEAYALILYYRNGLNDWSASKSCWQP
jgi:hypothetical protein